MTLCRSCRAQLVWARTQSGKVCPFDAQPVKFTVETHSRILPYDLAEDGDGNLMALPKVKDRMEYGDEFFVIHFQTCPNASQHKKVSG